MKAGHYLKAKSTLVFIKKLITIIWTVLQYDVNGPLTYLAFDAVPLKHCLDILVLLLTDVTMQQPTRMLSLGCQCFYLALGRSGPGNVKPALHPHCNIQAPSEPSCSNPYKTQVFASWFQEIKLPSFLIFLMDTNLL